MINKWNELDFDHFDEFFKSFENGDSWTKNRVLEIQDPYSILFKEPRRVFLGYGIKVNDYPDYNEKLLRLISVVQSTIPDLDILDKECLSLCFLTKEGGPSITPIVGDEGPTLMVRHALFGDKNKQGDLVIKIFGQSTGPGSWYEKDPTLGRVLWIPQREGITNKNRFLRFRTIDLDDWKRLVDDWINGKREEISKDDLKPEDFEIQPKHMKLVHEIAEEYGGLSKILRDRD